MEDRPGPVRLSATTPCSSMAGAAAVNVPSAPPPPGISTDAVIGVLAVSRSAAGIPPSDGTVISAADPPGRSIPLAPVGW